MERNRICVNAAVLETLSLTRRFGEYTAVDASRFRSPARASFPAKVCRIGISWLPASWRRAFCSSLSFTESRYLGARLRHRSQVSHEPNAPARS
jgi:hypothetical protein